MGPPGRMGPPGGMGPPGPGMGPPGMPPRGQEFDTIFVNEPLLHVSEHIVCKTPRFLAYR